MTDRAPFFGAQMQQLKFPFVFAMVLPMCAALSGTVWAQNALPEGEAKEAVQAMCVHCHQIGRVTGMHLSRGEWKNTVEDMVRMGAQIPRDWVDPIADYLALNFPETLGSAASGTHGVDVSMEIVRLPLQARAAQEIIANGNGSIWLMNHTAAKASRYTLSTANVTDRTLPASVKTAQSTAIAADGVLWFSFTEANEVGRLQPGSATLQLVQMPRVRATPGSR
jgi:hypothetical protein